MLPSIITPSVNRMSKGNRMGIDLSRAAWSTEVRLQHDTIVFLIDQVTDFDR
jgi:hypothetical protein